MAILLFTVVATVLIVIIVTFLNVTSSYIWCSNILFYTENTSF